MNKANVMAAMEDARKESHDIGQKLIDMNDLVERKRQLDEFISQCQVILGLQESARQQGKYSPVKIQMPMFEAQGTVRSSDNIKNWQKAVAIFQETNNRPMRLSELVKEFEKRGYQLSKDNPKEVMRGTMKAKPQIFAHDENDFTYKLRDWPETVSSTQAEG